MADDGTAKAAEPPLTKREKWRLHRLEFVRMARAYSSSEAGRRDPLRAIFYATPTKEEDP
jgi:hypothetical protein